MLKQTKAIANKIPITVSGLEHPSTSMLAACWATQHIVHGMDNSFGVYILFGLDKSAEAHVHSILQRALMLFPTTQVSPYKIKCFILSNTSTAKTDSSTAKADNVLFLSWSSNFKKGT